MLKTKKKLWVFKILKLMCFCDEHKIKSTQATQQIKEGHINFSVEDVEENWEEYRKAIELKDKLSNVKKILQDAKRSGDSIVQENKELKKYIRNIKQRYQQ